MFGGIQLSVQGVQDACRAQYQPRVGQFPKASGGKEIGLVGREKGGHVVLVKIRNTRHLDNLQRLDSIDESEHSNEIETNGDFPDFDAALHLFDSDGDAAGVMSWRVQEVTPDDGWPEVAIDAATRRGWLADNRRGTII